jgi:hypothetical protein
MLKLLCWIPQISATFFSPGINFLTKWKYISFIWKNLLPHLLILQIDNILYIIDEVIAQSYAGIRRKARQGNDI